MPRHPYARLLLALATLLPAPVSAQNPAPKSAATNASSVARVQHLVVRGSGDAMEVEIQTSGASIAPNTQAITGPDRIVVDFPGALPADDLHALKVNRGPLKGVRSGLFFNNPPITRIVLDLLEPHSYQISTSDHSVIVKLGAAKSDSPTVDSAKESSRGTAAPAARLQNAAAVTAGATSAVNSPSVPKVSNAVSAVSDTTAALQPAVEPPQPATPAVTVTLENGMLHIHADRATLAQVLFEVQRQTQAEIPIPAGAEQEQVFADLGPAPARDVLASLLNGSAYNFIFVGTEQHLERVLLTRRDSNPY